MSLSNDCQRAAEIWCDELGYNAFEISAHMCCAPDHEPIQGQVVFKAEYLKMQNGEDFYDVNGRRYSGFSRKIGYDECGHIAAPFDTRHSVRVYSDELLFEYARKNAEGCIIAGKHYTTYEASELMHEIEDEVRSWQQKAINAQIESNNAVREYCQNQINRLGNKYSEIVEISKLSSHRDRMHVPGFKRFIK